MLAVVLPWFAVMGGYVNRLRTRLSDSHRELQQAVERIGELAIRDELTGAYNRRYLMEALAREQSRAERLGHAVCRLPHRHRPLQVDQRQLRPCRPATAVLKDFARLVPQELRAVDVHGRFGGEEFLIVLPGTDAGGRAGLRRARARPDRSRRVSGRAARDGNGRAWRRTHGKEPVSALLARADKALYEGKSAGRNRVVTIG